MTDKSIKLFDNIIYGTDEHNLYFRELGSDTESNFLQNLKKQPNDWIYRNKKINYLRNNLGHRCKELDKLDNDFILFLGCSITEGVGLAIEDTYPFLLSKKLNLDYYNLGIGGTGIDVLSMNLSLWFSNIKKPPKMIVIQWPEIYRRIEIENKDITLLGPWSTDDHFKNEILGNSFNHYYNVLKTINISYINFLKIPMIDFTNEEIVYLDYARDLKHPGIDSNKNISDFLYNKIKSL
jgi:hypothetical protein